jgi:GNAT superfamily N-acetyltransferase
MGDLRIHRATDPEELEAIYRLRYRVYVEEMQFLGSVADHERKRLTDEDDAHGQVFAATLDGKVVGSIRINCGADAPFSPDHLATYRLDRFRAVIPDERMCIGSRFLVDPAHRRGTIPVRIIGTSLRHQRERGVDLAIGECQPHLLNLYQTLGFRSYGQTNHPQVGVLVLLVMPLGDHEHLLRVNSPLARFLVDPALAGDAEITGRVLSVLDAAGVLSADGPYSAEFWGEIYSLLEPGRRKAAHLLDNMNEAAVNAVLSGSNVIELSRGDYLMRRGARTQTVYVVLKGRFEILSDDRVLGVCEDGDVIGEIAFLLATHRTTDVRVISERASVLSLSERSLHRLMEYEAPIAATLLYNLCRCLAYRLVARTSG